MVVVASGNVKSEWFYENVEEKFSGIKHNYQLSKVEAEWKSGFSGEDRELEQTQLVLGIEGLNNICLLYTSPSPRDATLSRMPSSA